jgi:hypothetical protein
MLKVSQKYIDDLEQQYPGIRESIMYFENAELPACPHCGSDDTASVQVGAVGRLLAILRATSKVTMVANGPKPGEYFCNKCRKHFG